MLHHLFMTEYCTRTNARLQASCLTKQNETKQFIYEPKVGSVQDQIKQHVAEIRQLFNNYCLDRRWFYKKCLWTDICGELVIISYLSKVEMIIQVYLGHSKAQNYSYCATDYMRFEGNCEHGVIMLSAFWSKSDEDHNWFTLASKVLFLAFNSATALVTSTSGAPSCFILRTRSPWGK